MVQSLHSRGSWICVRVGSVWSNLKSRHHSFTTTSKHKPHNHKLARFHISIGQANQFPNVHSEVSGTIDYCANRASIVKNTAHQDATDQLRDF